VEQQRMAEEAARQAEEQSRAWEAARQGKQQRNGDEALTEAYREAGTAEHRLEEATQQAAVERTAREPKREAGTLRRVPTTRKRLAYFGVSALAVAIIAVALKEISNKTTEIVALTQQTPLTIQRKGWRSRKPPTRQRRHQ
jgi:hypothetical protein